MTTIYLIRHAEAEGNLYQRIHGQFDAPIIPNGYRQIEALSHRFAGKTIHACYASDLLRTRTTAQAISVPHNLPVVPDARLREIHLGIWEDRMFGWLYAEDAERMARFIEDLPHWSVEDSETFAQYTGRFIACVTEIAKNHEGQTVAVFSHAAVMRGAMLALFPEEKPGPADNTCVTRLEYENGRFIPAYFNDNSHLSPAISTRARKQSARKDFSLLENNLWFVKKQEGSFGVMSGHSMVGTLVLEHRPKETILKHMELKPKWRGRGLAGQLLGQAVYEARAKGHRELIIPPDPTLQNLFERMELSTGEDGFVHMDLTMAMKPFSYVPQDSPADGQRPPVIPVP